MRARVSWTPALDRDGRPAADLRVSAWQPPGENALSLLISNPASVWGRAGLHSGDRLVAVNGAAGSRGGGVPGRRQPVQNGGDGEVAGGAGRAPAGRPRHRPAP